MEIKFLLWGGAEKKSLVKWNYLAREQKKKQRQPDDKLLCCSLAISPTRSLACGVAKVEKFNTFRAAYPPCSQEQAISAASGARF